MRLIKIEFFFFFQFLFEIFIFFAFSRFWFCACCVRVNVTVTVQRVIWLREEVLPITLRHANSSVLPRHGRWGRKECESRNEGHWKRYAVVLCRLRSVTWSLWFIFSFVGIFENVGCIIQSFMSIIRPNHYARRIIILDYSIIVVPCHSCTSSWIHLNEWVLLEWVKI